MVYQDRLYKAAFKNCPLWRMGAIPMNKLLDPALMCKPQAKRMAIPEIMLLDPATKLPLEKRVNKAKAPLSP